TVALDAHSVNRRSAPAEGVWAKSGPKRAIRAPSAPGSGLAVVHEMTFRILFGLGAILAGATACSQGHAQPADTPAPPTVSIVQVSPERVAVGSEWIATLDGLVNAQIRPQ